MIKFLLKGILRDKSRSILPIIVVAIGVALTIALSAYLNGVFRDVIDQNARFETGHVKIMTQAYAKHKDQLPNDLALIDVAELKNDLKSTYPDVEWTERIQFGGLIDIADANGVSRGQGPIGGLALNLSDPNTKEATRMNLKNAIIEGKIPMTPQEVVVGYLLAEQLDLKIGTDITYFGTTMEGSMSFYNLKICGIVKYGMQAMDKSTIIVDIKAAQQMLDMRDAASQILGYLPNDIYNDATAAKMRADFNQKYVDPKDEYSPQMFSLREQNDLGMLIDYSEMMSMIFILIFVGAMSVVLWNTGLIGGLRRYKEYGIRLALGESATAIYTRMIMESVIIGVIGSAFGILIGGAGAYYLQVYGIDISGLMDDSSMLLPTLLRAQLSPGILLLGLVPGVLATVLGSMLSGRAIFKRQTAHLFKDLEV